MEKSYGLQCLDYACLKTMEKGGDYNSVSHISNSIQALLVNGYSAGFTHNEEARNYIKGLNSDDIEKELLLNLIKQKACERIDGNEIISNTTKEFDDSNLSKEEAITLIYNTIDSDKGVKAVKWALSKYPKLYSALSVVFVETRYFDIENYGMNKLDKVELNEKEKSLIDKIEFYYNELKQQTED